jgi:hypothetical protein
VPISVTAETNLRLRSDNYWPSAVAQILVSEAGKRLPTVPSNNLTTPGTNTNDQVPISLFLDRTPGALVISWSGCRGDLRQSQLTGAAGIARRDPESFSPSWGKFLGPSIP